MRVVVERMSKCYRLASRPWERGTEGMLGRSRWEGAQAGRVWALQEVSFRAAAGETIGIIGRNAAGKSTLLKILSRITEPTSGSVETRGRVASLLEVGTGFHSELTGRENIYLNGSILGMRKREIDAKLDAIVAFSEIGRFLDTPVKYYSSGMHLRLGFAVAAHLEPDILAVDEILSVGDAQFQRRCLGVLDGLQHDGRTVFLVSHNLAVVRQLCRRALWLEAGRLVADGPASEVVEQYLASTLPAAAGEPPSDPRRRPPGRVRVIGQELLPGRAIASGGKARLRMRLRAPRPMRSVTVTVSAFTALGLRVFDVYSSDGGALDLAAGEREIAVEVGPLPLCPQRYYLDIVVSGPFGEVLDRVERAVVLEVVSPDGLRSDPGGLHEGAICKVPASWKLGVVTDVARADERVVWA